MRKCFIVLILLASLPVFLVAQSGVHMSLFTGRMSYSIPIYTISDQDFHIDIALRYSSEGFKPFLPAGSCGQDWTMIAGGHITRSVQGLPDDLNYYGRITKWWYQHDTDNKIGIRGFIIGKEKGYARALALMNESDSIPQKEKVFNMDSTVYSDSCGIDFRQGMWIDYMPDIFYFNFCGYNGRFMINNSGKVVILSGDFVDVDISGLETNRGTEYDEFSWNVSDSSPKGFLQSGESSQIIIKTTDGYTYVFGGSKENPNWYFTESKLSKPFFKWDKENKRLYIMFFADSVNSIGAFHILTLKQLIVLPFKHRLYYSWLHEKEFGE